MNHPAPHNPKGTSINAIVSSGGGIRAGIGSRSTNAKVDLSQHRGNSVINQVSSQKKNNKSHVYSKNQMRIAGMIGHVVQKRHSSLIHMQKVFSKEGGLWMNCIKIHQQDIKQLIMTSAQPNTQDGLFSNLSAGDYRGIENNQTFMKQKIERYYNLGVSLSKCLGLFDCVNFVQYLLNLLEEYELYIVMQNHAYMKSLRTTSSSVAGKSNKSSGKHQMGSRADIDNPIIQRIIQQPHYNTFEIRQKDAQKREMYQQMREHKHCIQALQHQETLSKVIDEHSEVFSPTDISGQRGYGSPSKLGSLSPASAKNRSLSVDQSQIIYTGPKIVFSRNILPKLLNEPQTIGSFTDYKKQVSHHKHNERVYSAQVQKIKVAKLPDPIAPALNVGRVSKVVSAEANETVPYFKLYQCRNIVIHKMDYCDVVTQLIKILIMISNKTDTLILSDDMARKYLQADELLQQLVVREICADLGKVAQKLMIRQLAKVNTAMKSSGYQVTKEQS